MLGFKSAETKKANRYYLRFHQTISRALDFHRFIYKDQSGLDKKDKSKKQFKYEHALRVAGLTQEIQQQSLMEYHMNWLLGILHDDKEEDPVYYGAHIDEVLVDLLPDESNLVKKYIDQMSKDMMLTKGEQKLAQVEMMDKMDLIPSYIKLFDKYDNCSRFLKDSCGKSPTELNGYFAVSLECYDKAMSKHEELKKNLNIQVRDFFQKLRTRLGSPGKIKEYAEYYYKNV